jgi:hypothetical protein
VVKIASGQDAAVDFNFKEIASKQGAAYQEAAKKQEEGKAKLEGLKAHFAAGNALVEQEKQAKVDMAKLPADQRDAAKQKLTDLSDQAAKEFQEAAKNLVDKDPNAHLVWFNLGQAYDTANRNDEAIRRTNRRSPPRAIPGYSKYERLARGRLKKESGVHEVRELDPPCRNGVAQLRDRLYLGGGPSQCLCKNQRRSIKNNAHMYLLASCRWVLRIFTRRWRQAGDYKACRGQSKPIKGHDLDGNGPGDNRQSRDWIRWAK